MARFIVEEPGYLNGKVWLPGEVIESATPLPPSTWYCLEGQEELHRAQEIVRKAKIEASQQVLMNVPVNKLPNQ